MKSNESSLLLQEGDLLNLKEGIIIHQVNCCNAMGAGLALQLKKKYPRVAKQYHRICDEYARRYQITDKKPIPQLLGKYQTVMPDRQKYPRLAIVNLFSQLSYGRQPGRVYTDVPSLIRGIRTICNKYPKIPVYIPEKIGCGLAGADWKQVSRQLDDLHLENLHIIRYVPQKQADLQATVSGRRPKNRQSVPFPDASVKTPTDDPSYEPF